MASNINETKKVGSNPRLIKRRVEIECTLHEYKTIMSVSPKTRANLLFLKIIGERARECFEPKQTIG